jgi:hypothetical protein
MVAIGGEADIGKPAENVAIDPSATSPRDEVLALQKDCSLPIMPRNARIYIS